ncbi:NlpC/P60 family protein [Arenibacter sp. GZD-96]|uniref:C40 family peptidase n=1 Tax=Aurantibrevibacter litoralis TaxID=3106030 RepID=UPI003A4DB0DB
MSLSFGACILSCVPVRSAADHFSEMRTQLLYGDHFTILEQRKKWSKIRIAFDRCEGWILNNQLITTTADEFKNFEAIANPKFVSELLAFAETEQKVLIPLMIGSCLDKVTFFSHQYHGSFLAEKARKSDLIKTAMCYINAPFMWGGKTPFGIDCSGFTQMVYKINGYPLLRDVGQQATQGEVLSFIEESEAGDLAFFDNADGNIHHVGILMDNHYIIHVHGKVRIDRIDHTGIFNVETKRYTHKLRVIKKIL